MFGSIPIGTVLGIPIRIHVLFLVLVAFLVFAPGTGAVEAAAFAMLAAIVVLHELGHSLMARRFGVRVIDITLWPLGGLARLSHIPESSRVEGWIAVAGPAVNFALAVLGLPLWFALSAWVGPQAVAAQLAFYFVAINVLMGGFNLLPAFPTDGGRILRAWLARKQDWLRATEGAVRVGRVMAVLLCIVGFALQSWMLPILALWLWWMGSNELAQVRARHARQSPLDAFGEFARAAAAGFREPPPAPDDGPRTGYATQDIERLEKFRGSLKQLDKDV